MADTKVPTTTPDWQAAVRRRMDFDGTMAVILCALV